MAPIDYAILGVYFAFVLGIGWVVRPYVTRSEDFFLAGGHGIGVNIWWGAGLVIFGLVMPGIAFRARRLPTPSN